MNIQAPPTIEQLQEQVQTLNDMLQVAVVERNQVSNDKLQMSAKLMAEQRKIKELSDKIVELEKKLAEKPAENGHDAAHAPKKAEAKREARAN